MAVRIKICGITHVRDALAAVEAGAWALGFIFYKKSGRYLAPGKARAIVDALPPFVTPVGVFVDEKEAVVRRICRLARITTIQFHGEESSGYCRRLKGFKIIKAFRVSGSLDPRVIRSYKVDAYLFDAFSATAVGGTGQTFDWTFLKNSQFDKPVILSGGLNAGNVRRAVEAVRPYAVDVSSGVELSPGNKDHHLLQSFTAALRSCSVLPMHLQACLPQAGTGSRLADD